LVQAQIGSSTVTKLYKWPYTGGESLKALVRSKSIPVHLLPSCGKFRAKVTSWDRIMALFGLASRSKGSPADIINWCNGAANRFVVESFLELEELRVAGKMSAYWARA
jgi:hypothetical protein